MEIMCAIVSFRAVWGPSIITLYSDSQFVIKTMTRSWKLMKNLDLWTRLDDAAKAHQITWTWVRGHNGNPGNGRGDALANRAARRHARPIQDARYHSGGARD
jgi:ribonuclease HI